MSHGGFFLGGGGLTAMPVNFHQQNKALFTLSGG
jgi:hypothetical protein